MNEYENNPSLLDVFKVGDKVKQIYYKPSGGKKEYTGIVKFIKEHCMAIHWETVNGKPVEDINVVLTVCHEDEVFNGNEYTSPIEKENY
jgi:hypothetical protein